jgi:hypothetical protein
MKDLKTIIAESKNGNATFSLSASDLDKILYSLAFTATWGDADMDAFKKLWNELAEGSKKAFGDDASDIIPENWSDYECPHRGTARRLN